MSSFQRLLLPILSNSNQFMQCQVRHLPRWKFRSPVNVIPAEEYDEIQDKPKTSKFQIDDEYPHQELLSDQQNLSTKNKETALNYALKSHAKKPLTISKNNQAHIKAKITTTDMLETIIDEEGNFIYTKMQNNDSRIGSILVDLKSKKERNKNDLILLEGKRLIKDALESGCTLKYILFSRFKEVEYLRPYLPNMGAKLYKMPYREMQMWSGLTTNPGIMGVFKIPDVDSFTPSSDSLPLTIICDNIREASNLGAVLRTCGGLGCQEVILTKGCVNVWDSKVLRSACGTHFRLRIHRKQTWEEISGDLKENSSVFIADNHTISAGGDDSISSKTNLSQLIQSVPVLPYYGVNFTSSDHIVLIVGGETEGISEDSYNLAKQLNGVRLNVPLSNNVESLNIGVALGIIAFEMKRQMNVNRNL
ncbi:unnamed protein product [Phaedon cochleariae]|uniref:RNA 2-O ribose methyltransferase substrate binding domain-containing protein n=1 Tax=Phaedon cochleariae TaxID=80249 RepID=A0A9P0GT07_PHACE|nr:unnamed protein product [Phaedon cochleariae]